jgi:hypothetical protein
MRQQMTSPQTPERRGDRTDEAPEDLPPRFVYPIRSPGLRGAVASGNRGKRAVRLASKTAAMGHLATYALDIHAASKTRYACSPPCLEDTERTVTLDSLNALRGGGGFVLCAPTCPTRPWEQVPDYRERVPDCRRLGALAVPLAGRPSGPPVRGFQLTFLQPQIRCVRQPRRLRSSFVTSYSRIDTRSQRVTRPFVERDFGGT